MADNGRATEDKSPDQEVDEVERKRIGRRLRDADSFRAEVFSRDPDAPVDPEDAAAILGVGVAEIAPALDSGRLGFVDIDGSRVIRVSDLQTCYEADRRKFEEFAQGWSELRSRMDSDE